MEPQTRIGMANLTKWAFEGVDLTPLRQQLLTQCQLEQHPHGHLMDLSVIDQLTGNRAQGLEWQAQALSRQRAFSTNRRDAAQRKLLVFAEPSDIGGNTPIELLLQGSEFEIITYYPTFHPNEAARLPDHDVAFCAAPADGARAQAFFDGVRRLTAASAAPVLNLPGPADSLDREGLEALCQSIPGLRVPRTLRAHRADLDSAIVALGFPLIIRPVGSHAGQGLRRIDMSDALFSYLEEQPEGEFFLSEFIDYASSDDGLYRKYRIVFADGAAYPCHMAIADRWDIWYLNAGMDQDAAKRAEEAAFMDGFDQGFAKRHQAAFQALSARVGFDYFGIDCAEDADGNLVLFEADNALIVHDMDPGALFPYKGRHMRRIFAAVERMLHGKCLPQAGPKLL